MKNSKRNYRQNIQCIFRVLLNQRNFILLVGFVSLMSLGFAYASQYFFDVNPCVLCLYERLIYWALVALAGMTLLIQGRTLLSDSRKSPVLFSLLGIILLGGFLLGVYHLGVEWHWWEGTASCKGITQKATTIEEMRQLINKRQPARCDQPSWMIFGVSATIWNGLWYLGFLFLWVLTWIRTRK